MSRPLMKPQSTQTVQLYFTGASKRSPCGRSFANTYEKGKAANKLWWTSLYHKPEVSFVASKNEALGITREQLLGV